MHGVKSVIRVNICIYVHARAMEGNALAISFRSVWSVMFTDVWAATTTVHYAPAARLDSTFTGGLLKPRPACGFVHLSVAVLVGPCVRQAHRSVVIVVRGTSGTTAAARRSPPAGTAAYRPAWLGKMQLPYTCNVDVLRFDSTYMLKSE